MRVLWPAYLAYTTASIPVPSANPALPQPVNVFPDTTLPWTSVAEYKVGFPKECVLKIRTAASYGESMKERPWTRMKLTSVRLKADAPPPGWPNGAVDGLLM